MVELLTRQTVAGLMQSGPLPERLPTVAAVPVVESVVAVAVPAAGRRGHVRRRLLADIVRGGLIIAIINLFLVQVSIVRGHSMEPSLRDGDRLVVDRLAYALGGVQRFDVVVLRYPRDPNVDFVKRVVALPGEHVRLEAGRVYVDGKLLTESFAHVSDRAFMRELTVPDDHYFVLGDNRPISCDSREFGLVEAALLKGKVRARFWPLGRAGTI
jgi:signal peptidase I